MYKIGILGAAGIAPNAIIEPARRRADVLVGAVASRNYDVASNYAERHQIPRAHAGYDALLNDPEIDIIYNALPPAAHAEWTIKALAAGKHVLCEKPFAMTAAEASAMVSAADANKRVLMEAFHDRYHPVFLHLLSLKPRLGAIRSLTAEFRVDIPYDPASIRYDPNQGGGALMDLGCYPLHWLRSFMGSEPSVVSASARLCDTGTDVCIAADLRFPEGVAASLLADLQDPPYRALLRVEAEHGVVELDNPCLPHNGHSFREWLNGSHRVYTLDAGATYDYQLAAFLDALANGSALPTGGADAVENMRLIEEIYAQAGVRSG